MRDKIDKMKEDVREFVTGSNTDNDLRARLHADHEDVGNLIDRMISAKDESMRSELCARVVFLLTAHARAEEEVVYGFLHQRAIDRGDLNEAMRDHREIDRCLDQLKTCSVADPKFVEYCRGLKEAVTHHVHDEENTFLPQAEKDIGQERLAALIPQFNQRKSELMTQALRAVERGWQAGQGAQTGAMGQGVQSQGGTDGLSMGFEEHPSQAK